MGRKPVDVLRVVMAVSAALFLFVLAMPTLAVGESDSSSNTFPMYRVYNRWSGEHLFTADAGEYASLGSIGWKQGGCGLEVTCFWQPRLAPLQSLFRGPLLHGGRQ